MPALINLDSLLEVKAVLPTLAAKWAKIVRGSLVVRTVHTHSPFDLNLNVEGFQYAYPSI